MARRPVFVVLIRSPRPDFTRENMTPEERAAMLAHVTYQGQLLAEKKLILSGPCLDGAFGMGLIEAESAEEMRQIMEHDPAISSGAMTAEWHQFLLGHIRVPEDEPAD